MRLIDVDRLIEGVDEIMDDLVLPEDLKGDFIKDLIDQQPIIEQNQWISCSESLPQERYLVIVFIKHEYAGLKSWWTMEISAQENGIFECDKLGHGKPIAWMPLPQPYKEVSNE